MTLVSVVMPCFNAADTLPEALESLTGQTLVDFELIAVDDGSSDATASILKEWAVMDARIRPIFQPHSGIVVALNNGWHACQSPLIARMDADDLAHPERLERQVAFLDMNPEIGVVACRVEGYPQEEVRQGFMVYLDWQNSLLTDVDIRREMFVESPLAHPSVIIRQEWLSRVGGYQDHGWPEDYDLWLRLYLAGARFAKLPDFLLHWREHPQRLTRQDSRYSLENFLRLKAHYLARGPLNGKGAVLVWGAGMMGRRLSKHLLRQGVPLTAFVDIDPAKIGRTRWRLPIISPEKLPAWWQAAEYPAVLAAVGARGARQLIRQHLNQLGLREARDWWSVA
jgi:glycosyltransferase involved in cell wall biosynthesis